ncbi:MAG: hypothetical protein K0S11_35 [Gammaproteobacteria bacterium]|jgi:hypothetical protein|nr:hypothetical protein [Gammaproteobacteria bacterium]
MKKSKQNEQAKTEQKITTEKSVLDTTALEQASGGCCTCTCTYMSVQPAPLPISINSQTSTTGFILNGNGNNKATAATQS